MKYLVLLLFTAACSGTIEEVSLTAHDGAPGVAAVCTVSQTEGGATVECSDGSSATVLNGSPGQQAGSFAAPVYYTSSGCTHISGTDSYVSISGGSRGLYTGSTCAGNTKFATVSQGEAYWVSSTALAVWATNGVAVIELGGAQ